MFLHDIDVDNLLDVVVLFYLFYFDMALLHYIFEWHCTFILALWYINKYDFFDEMCFIWISYKTSTIYYYYIIIISPQ